ncbi:RepB family plasmid replication initiator protein [Sulfurimonas paralvinellae]|uniref:Initiator Rep protein WH1 domain-containing protein n=1 Tax=Sulfurimonas paralvinellae TaxID=317658 RepID=A0A7M1BBU7_9BACT|nr:RepB family plasmid replication initiator protein [Sulfurimonas paralvinellae]QOP46288.1 hypothetical protein FM071_08285 [Sulfurimonas paralvinellae]
MNINNGDYKKNNQLINRLSYIDDKKNLVSITLNEEKLLEYFFFSLQKRHIIRKDIKKESFYWEKNEWGEFLKFKTDTKEFESVQFEIELYGLKTFMKVEEQNYIEHIREILSRFSKRQINYIRNLENGTQERTIMPVKDFIVDKINGEKNYRVLVHLNIEFLYLSLFKDGQYTPLNINTVKNIRSKYSLRMYSEIEKALNLKYDKLPLRSLKSMNEFFGTNLSKQKMEQNIYRVKQEFLLNRMYSFKYEVYKNENKEWIFSITDIKKLTENDIILDYVDSYLDYRLLTPELKQQFQKNYISKLEEIEPDSKTLKSVNAQTKHLQRKQKEKF